MKRKNKNKIANWVLLGCAVITIGICIYEPTITTSGCAGFCTGIFIANGIYKH